jgi:hypothetical protein
MEPQQAALANRRRRLVHGHWRAGYVRFKTKLPGFYCAQVRFPGNPSFLHASSQWAKFKAPTVLR